MDLAAASQPCLSGFSRFWGQWSCAFASNQADFDTGRRSQTGDNIAVTAIVAMTAQHQPVVAGRVLVKRQGISGLSGTLHQLV
ncbi:hypothetical protein D3C78_1534220 [compost metagenome]